MDALCYDLVTKNNEIDDIIIDLIMSRNDEYLLDNNHWYQFKNHRWEIENSDKIPPQLLYDINLAFIFVASRLEKELLITSDLNQINKYLIKCRLGITKLKTNTYQNLIYNQLKSTNQLDVNPLLFCCKNGVLDLKSGLFRDGKFDDYCSLRTKLDYIEYNENDTEVQLFNEHFSKTFPDIHHYTDFIDTMTLCLKINCNNLAIMKNNSRYCSGKSTVEHIIRIMFGSYFTMGDICNMDNIDTKNKRFILTTDANSTISHSKIIKLMKKYKLLWIQSEDIHVDFFEDVSNIKILNFESIFSNDKRYQKSRGFNFFVANNNINHDLLATVLLWKLFNNFQKQSYKFFISECGCNTCQHDYIDNIWPKISILYKLDLCTDVHNVIAQYYVKL